MLYLIVSIIIGVALLFLFKSILDLNKSLINKINSQQTQIINLARSINDIQSQLDDSNIESKREREQIIEKFNKRLDKTTQESLSRDNITLSHLNKTIRQLNNGFHPEELEFPK